jgi:hypothetical protein
MKPNPEGATTELNIDADMLRRGYKGEPKYSVPYSPADVCWCQPNGGPIHPHCPMHGIVEGSTLSETQQERSDSARKYLNNLAREERQAAAVEARWKEKQGDDYGTY